MSKKVKNNVVWVDFKSKRAYDLSRLGHPEVSKQPVPYLCQPKKLHRTSKGEHYEWTNWQYAFCKIYLVSLF
jgi:hypothetical protein